MKIPDSIFRVALVSTARSPFVNAIGGLAIVLIKNSAAQFQCAAFQGDASVSTNFYNDLSDVVSATLVVRQETTATNQATASSPLVIQRIINGAAINGACTYANWLNQTDQQFTFSLSNTDTNLSAGSIWIAIGITKSSGDAIPLGFANNATIFDDGIFSGGAAPLAPPDVPISRTEAFADFATENDPRIVNAIQYAAGLVNDGVTDNTATLQAYFNALPSTGGAIYLPSGRFAFTAGSLAINAPCKLIGAGGGAYSDLSGAGATLESGIIPGGTTLITTSLTGNGITVNASGCTFQDFALLNQATGVPTSGAGILGNRFTDTRVNRVFVEGFLDNIHVVNGYGWSLTNSLLFDAVHAALWIEDQATHDGGDMNVSGNTFSQQSTARNVANSIATNFAVLYQSGGGLRFSNNKINNGIQNGLAIIVPDGVSTGDCLIENNNIENVVYNAIYHAQAGPSNTGVLSNVTIVGNHIAYCGAAGNIGVITSGSQNALSQNLLISENFVYQSGGFTVDHWNGGRIGKNYFNAVTLPVNLTANAASIAVDDQQRNGNGFLWQNASGTSICGGNHRQAVNGSGTLTLYRCAVNAYQGGALRVRLGGTVPGAGTVTLEQTYLFEREGGTTVNLTQVSSASAGNSGALGDITFSVVNTTAGEIQVVAVASGGIGGFCSIAGDGFASLKVGP